MDLTEMQMYLDTMKEDLEKALAYLRGEFVSIRAGRANPHILDKILVDYYGVPTPINQMANVSVPEARMLCISVWDQSALKSVSKAIMESDIGITPSDDGKMIRLVFPMLTEERRKDLCKQVKTLAEQTKVNMRNARRDTLDLFKSMKKDGQVSEDEYAQVEKDVQKQLDAYIAKIDEELASKEKEIMEI